MNSIVNSRPTGQVKIASDYPGFYRPDEPLEVLIVKNRESILWVERELAKAADGKSAFETQKLIRLQTALFNTREVMQCEREQRSGYSQSEPQ
jgi:hypothetical protein